jgi:hypothetical protein
MVPGGRRLCERDIHNQRWMGAPEHDADTDRWWVEAACRICGHRERVDVTGSHNLSVWQFGQARDALMLALIEASRLDRLVAWLDRKRGPDDVNGHARGE